LTLAELDARAREAIGLYRDVPGLDSPAALAAEAGRYAEQANWIQGAGSVLDIGGGYGPFAVMLASMGVRAVSMDEFSHPYFSERLDHRKVAEDAGVELVRQDAVSGLPLPFPDQSFEAVTSVDSMEHWHHSPKQLLSEVRRVLTPGGRLVIGVPNAVNLRKRLSVPLGKTNWSRFEDWYEEPVFYGHVREPTVGDLNRIASDMGLSEWHVVGRNWLGFRGGSMRQRVAAMVDPILRYRPTLCANIYLIGTTPTTNQ
jgi:SAM-dependent methyltransferase